MQNLLKVFQQYALEWGLNLPEAVVFDYLYEATAWADPVILDGRTWYWLSRTKAAKDLLLLSGSKTREKIVDKLKAGEPLTAEDGDTFYRHYKSLSKKGLIKLSKASGKDCYILTEKAKNWNKVQHGKFSEYPENYPAYNYIELSNSISSIPGKFSEHPEVTPDARSIPGKLPPEEVRIQTALKACTEYFKEWPDMKTALLERIRLKLTQEEFEEQLESWIRHNSQNLIFMQDPTKQISKSFQRWLGNTKNFTFKKPKPKPKVDRSKAKKSFKRSGSLPPEVAALARQKKV
jgi:hypothetical protein